MSNLKELTVTLLNNNWDVKDRNLLKKMLENLLFYKKLIPKALKNDVVDILVLSNNVKLEFDKLKLKYECKCIKKSRRNSI